MSRWHWDSLAGRCWPGWIFGHFGRIGPIFIRMPRAGRYILSEVGLALFLAQAGSQAGEQLVEVVSKHGAALCGAAIAITIAPLIVGALLARFALNLPPMLERPGGSAAMTSTPGLGAAATISDSSIPTTSYAAVYPIALILVTALTPLLLMMGS
ncbi:MAG: hypothetical protein R3B90_20590 [Planctomycetaceae bacterium]